MNRLDSNSGRCLSVTHRLFPIILSFIFAVMLSAFTGKAWATCHSGCYNVDLSNDGECVDGKSVWDYEISIGTTESCYSLNKFSFKVLDCDDVDSVTDGSGNSVPNSCSDGVLLINPSGTIPSQDVVNANQTFTFHYKVIMKDCLQCSTGGKWKTFSGPENSCQFEKNTEVPEACECRTDENCDDHDACTDDVCEEGNVCSHTPNTGNSCDDDNSCTTEDSCHDGVCSGTLISEDCKECEGSKTCDDGLLCNGVETCGEDRICHKGTPILCEDDGNACTDDLCTEDAKGCDHPPNDDNSCDDGNECTSPDHCSDGVCIPGEVDSECVCEGGDCPPPGCGNGTCDEGEACGSCPADCGQCPIPPPQGEEQDPIQAQKLKCAQDLVAESNGRLSAQQAENLADELVSEGEPCTLILESGSGGAKVGGCAFQPDTRTASMSWMGLACVMIGWAPLAVRRVVRPRRR